MHPNDKGMNGKPGYDEAAARDAWSRIDAFFAGRVAPQGGAQAGSGHG